MLTGLATLAVLLAQSPPVLTVDAAANRHPISPWVYGINQYSDSGLGSAMHIPLRRIGGDATTAYNWNLDVYNAAADYFFENFLQTPGQAPLPAGNSVNLFHESDLASGALTMGTISLMDWTPKDAAHCSYSVAKYGAQQKVNPYNKDCGNGILASNGQQIAADPNDAYIPVDPTFEQQWVRYLVNRYGPANQGGIRLWSMDNEPEWWFGVHIDIYQKAATYDDMLARNMKMAQVVKGADPTALIVGPVPGGWSGMFFSRTDMQSGWGTKPYYYWDNPIDQKAHGGVPWLAYYLQQMKNFEQQNGHRLLDVVDVHAYITPDSLSASAGNAANEQLRTTSTRAFWDPNYLVPMSSYGNRLFDQTGNEAAPMLIPRMRQWVADAYPGTGTSISEYNWGALNSITGAIAQADILGIFGRESLDYGMLWGPPAPTDPGAFAFRMFLNYDGTGDQFGSASVSATTSDPDTLSIFAAQRPDSALTVLVLNKTAGDIQQSVSIANFAGAGTAGVWQYSPANLKAIVHPSDVALSASSVPLTFPAYSMTLLVLPRAQSAMTVPQPVVNSVNSAASYDASAVAPGEIVTIFGQTLGPASVAGLQVTADNALSTATGGVQVFFNGYAAPMIYASAAQLGAVVPYEIAGQSAVNVVVVNQGNPSAPFSVKIARVHTAVFTNDASGRGQGAVLNQDLSRNSPTNPAGRGQFVAVYGTGEGVTTPPGLDGQITGSAVPVASAACSATVGGIFATVVYCGETPNAVNGLVQVNVKIPDNVAPGASVPVSISIGGVTSQTGVTIAVN